jgi:hypothetical protein
MALISQKKKKNPLDLYNKIQQEAKILLLLLLY